MSEAAAVAWGAFKSEHQKMVDESLLDLAACWMKGWLECDSLWRELHALESSSSSVADEASMNRIVELYGKLGLPL